MATNSVPAHAGQIDTFNRKDLIDDREHALAIADLARNEQDPLTRLHLIECALELWRQQLLSGAT